MVIRVVTEQLPVCVQGAGDVRTRVDGLTHLEERALHGVRVQDGADLQGVRVVRTVVERDGDARVAPVAVRGHATEPLHRRVVATDPEHEARGEERTDDDEREPVAPEPWRWRSSGTGQRTGGENEQDRDDQSAVAIRRES